MLYLLIALQLSSTNCIADAAGVIHCTTLSTPQIQAPPIPKKSGSSCALCNLISIFDGSAKKRHAKAVGNMLAKGDCVGAERYALQKGDLDLADRVKAHCRQTADTGASAPPTARWLHVATTAAGRAFYTDIRSLREEGRYLSAWERVLPPASDPKRETRALNFYNCLERSSAVKMVVDYFRDGEVRSQTVEASDLKFTPVVPQTIGEASFEVVCTRRSASK